jgi:hypothetical protein
MEVCIIKAGFMNILVLSYNYYLHLQTVYGNVFTLQTILLLFELGFVIGNYKLRMTLCSSNL